MDGLMYKYDKSYLFIFLFTLLFDLITDLSICPRM